jgi:hypothetical protein
MVWQYSLWHDHLLILLTAFSPEGLHRDEGLAGRRWPSFVVVSGIPHGRFCDLDLDAGTMQDHGTKTWFAGSESQKW